MKDKIGIKAAIALAIVAVAVASYVGMRSMGGGSTDAHGATYSAPTSGIDMEKLNANPNTPAGISGAGGG